MLRLPLLFAAALVLPNVGQKPAHLLTRPVNSTVANIELPHIRLPHFPKRKHEYEGQVALMKLRLHNLVTQQEQWYSEHNSYSKDGYKLSTLGGDSTAASVVQLQIVFAGKKGWSATASHPDAPGKSCVMFVGANESLPLIPRTRADGIEATNEAVAVCDAK